MIAKVRKVELENFQSHKHTVLDFTDGTVVLAGESSNGKTSVLRGINWLATNRPSGTGFVSHWAMDGGKIAKGKRCSVTMTVVDMEGKAHTVSRVRSSTENKYVLDGLDLSAVGMDVPHEVSDLLALREVNRQNQDDSYFFLTLSPGQVSSKLNELVHLDTIDEAFGFAHRRKVEANVLFKENEIELTETKVELDGMKHLPNMQSMYEEAKEYSDEIGVAEDKLSEMEHLIGKLERVDSDMERLPSESLDKDMARLTCIAEDIEELRTALGAMNGLLRKMEEIDKDLRMFPNIGEEVIRQLHEDVSDHDRKCRAYTPMGSLLDKLTQCEGELEITKGKLDELSDKLPKVCPLCGNVIGEDHDGCTES